MAKKKKEDTTPAIPPDDYKGSQADWMTGLISRGLWDGNGWHGDVEIPTDKWWELLESCEGEEDEEIQIPQMPDNSRFCCYCGRGFNHHIVKTKDHLIPLSKGGSNNSVNKRNCCKHCNSEKKNLIPHDYLRDLLLWVPKVSATPSVKYNLDIKIENVKYIIQYVETAGEKLFQNKERYKWFQRRYLTAKNKIS